MWITELRDNILFNIYKEQSKTLHDSDDIILLIDGPTSIPQSISSHNKTLVYFAWIPITTSRMYMFTGTFNQFNYNYLRQLIFPYHYPAVLFLKRQVLR